MMVRRRRRESLKNVHAERATFFSRSLIACIFAALGLVALVVRLVDLQIVQYEYFSTRADENRMRVVPVAPVVFHPVVVAPSPLTRSDCSPSADRSTRSRSRIACCSRPRASTSAAPTPRSRRRRDRSMSFMAMDS